MDIFSESQSPSLTVPFSSSPPDVRHFVREDIHRQWVDLDHLPVRFWESRTIRPKIVYYTPKEWDGEAMRMSIGVLLPEMTGRGIIELTDLYEFK